MPDRSLNERDDEALDGGDNVIRYSLYDDGDNELTIVLVLDRSLNEWDDESLDGVCNRACQLS